MNTKEFARKHGKKAEWVRERCNEGMMPFAEKKGGRWDIPDDAELPPCTGREAALIMENVLECAGGKAVRLIPSRMEARGEAILRYLEGMGFISRPDENGAIEVTGRGMALIGRLNSGAGGRSGEKGRQNEVKSSFGVRLKVSGNLHIAGAEAEVHYERESAPRDEPAGGARLPEPAGGEDGSEG